MPEPKHALVVASPTAATTKRKRPRVDHAARRNAYLDIAAEVMLARGLHNATMAEIAAAAGAPKILFYRLFPSRDALVEAIYARVIGAVREAAAAPAGVRTRETLAAGRRDRAAFLLVLKNCRASPQYAHWAEDMQQAVVDSCLWIFQLGPDAPEGAAERVRPAILTIWGPWVETVTTWLEDSDGLDDDTRLRWWLRVLTAWREAMFDVYRLGPTTSDD